jgi:sulfoxide reductase heme-binding subunit YedZ
MQWPWQDRTGRLSTLRAGVFGLMFVPGLWLLGRALAQDLGSRPYNAVIHEVGLWSFRLLLIALAVTPLRRIGGWPKLTQVRRIIGVAAAAYLMAHLIAYMLYQSLDLVKIGSEIIKRLYLTIGFVALVGVMAMAVTSTDRMVRRMGGKRWQQLHYLAYPMTLLGLIHFFMQEKLDISEPTIMAGVFGWLMGYRAAYAFRGRGLPITWLAGLGLGVCLLTALGEALYYNYLSGAPILRILEANLSLDLGLRPAGAVLLFVAVPVLIALAAPLWVAPGTRRVAAD